MKSKPALAEEALTDADKAAQRTFAKRPGLSPALLPESSAVPAEWDGRRHRKDAYFIELRRIRPDLAQPRVDGGKE